MNISKRKMTISLVAAALLGLFVSAQVRATDNNDCPSRVNTYECCPVVQVENGGGKECPVDTTIPEDTTVDTTVVETTVVETTIVETTAVDTTGVETTVVDDTTPETTVVATTVPKLPKTGSSSGLVVAIGFILTIIGGAMWTVRRPVRS